MCPGRRGAVTHTDMRHEADTNTTTILIRWDYPSYDNPIIQGQFLLTALTSPACSTP